MALACSDVQSRHVLCVLTLTWKVSLSCQETMNGNSGEGCAGESSGWSMRMHPPTDADLESLLDRVQLPGGFLHCVICCAVLCCAVLCCAILTTQCHAVPCCAVLCCAILTTQCHAVLCCAVLCCAVLCCAVPYSPRNAILCCAVLCCAVLCCAVLCCADHTMLWLLQFCIFVMLLVCCQLCCLWTSLATLGSRMHAVSGYTGPQGDRLDQSRIQLATS